MKEIGGYIEFEHYHGEMLHDDAIKLNSGRSCLAYLIKAKNIKKLAIPYFLCDCIEDTCKKNNVEVHYYHIGANLLPVEIKLEKDEWIYLVNYYGQLSKETIMKYKSQYDRLILDNAHAYFDDPIPGIDTIYTCRKFFGVTDGGILYTDINIDVIQMDVSFDRIRFLAGRFERTAKEFFDDSICNEEHFFTEPVKRMSVLTENILKSIDYKRALEQRKANITRLHDRFGNINGLSVDVSKACFMYPLMLDHASEIRKKLIENNIYIPRLWPNVINGLVDIDEGSVEYKLVMNTLPLPVDQRYDGNDMDYMIRMIEMQGALKNES